MNFCLNPAYEIIKEYENYNNLEPLKKLLEEGGEELQDQGIRKLILGILNGKDIRKKWVDKNKKKIEKRDHQVIGLIYYYRAKGFPVWGTDNRNGSPVTCCHKALEDIKEMSKEKGWPELTSPESVFKNIWKKRKQKVRAPELRMMNEIALAGDETSVDTYLIYYNKQ